MTLRNRMVVMMMAMMMLMTMWWWWRCQWWWWRWQWWWWRWRWWWWRWRWWWWQWRWWWWPGWWSRRWSTVGSSLSGTPPHPQWNRPGTFRVFSLQSMMLKLEMIRTTMIWKYLFIDCGTLLLTTSTSTLFLVDCLVPKMLQLWHIFHVSFCFYGWLFRHVRSISSYFQLTTLIFPFNLSFPHQRSGQIIFFALFNVFIPSFDTFCRIIMGALCIRKLCPRSSHP